MEITTMIKTIAVIGLCLWFTIAVLLRIDHENTRVRTLAMEVVWIAILTIMIILFPSEAVSATPLLIYCIAILSTLYLQQRETVFRGVAFVALIIISLISSLLLVQGC